MRIDEFWAIQMMLQNQQTRESRTERISRGPLKTKNEQQVITAILTRNQLIHKGPWVRILPSPSRKKPLLSTRTREVFLAFRGKIALNIGKCLQNRGWNGHRGRTNPCFWLFGGEMSVLLFALLYRAKKLAKQHPTVFEYGERRDVAEKRQQNLVNRRDLCYNI